MKRKKKNQEKEGKVINIFQIYFKLIFKIFIFVNLKTNFFIFRNILLNIYLNYFQLS